MNAELEFHLRMADYHAGQYFMYLDMANKTEYEDNRDFWLKMAADNRAKFEYHHKEAKNHENH